MISIEPRPKSEVEHCATCGSGLCFGPDATPYVRALSIKGCMMEWAEKDIPAAEYEKWVAEFMEGQIDCAVRSALAASRAEAEALRHSIELLYAEYSALCPDPASRAYELVQEAVQEARAGRGRAEEVRGSKERTLHRCHAT